VNVIYTVETGEWSDHTIHAFCTTLEEAKRCAAAVWAKHREDYYIEDDEVTEHIGDNYRWPRVFENAANTLRSYLFTDLHPKRVKWCDEDPAGEKSR